MAKQTIDTTTNNGTHIGDPAKTAFEKVNANFNELYPAALPGTEAERAAARGRMGLQDGAVSLRQTADYDATPGRLMRTPAFGWGASYSRTGGIAATDDLTGGSGGDICSLSRYHIGTPGRPMAGIGYGVALNMPATTGGGFNYGVQLFFDYAADVISFRRLFETWQPELQLIHTGNTAALPITESLSPAADNTVSYGTAARRPTQLFAATATIGTSDAREKTPVRGLTEAEYAVGLQLAREIGAYQWLEAVERKGAGAREHFGQTVQRAIQIFQQHGLDPFGYGAICYDTWERETVEHPAQYEQIEIPAVLDEQGNEIAPARYKQGALIREAWTEVTLKAGDRYSWRDSELFWLMIAAQQRQADELARQQEQILQRLAALERGA